MKPSFYSLKSIKPYFYRKNTTLTALMVKGASGTFALKVFYTGATFLITILLTRFLGAEEFGLYSFALSWSLLLSILAKFGMGQIVTKNIAAYQTQNDFPRMKGMLNFAFFVIGVVSVASSLGAIGISWFILSDSNTHTVLSLAFMLILLQALLVPANAAQSGLQQVVRAQLPTSLIQPSLFIVLLLLIWLIAPQAFSAKTVFILLIITSTAALVSALLLLKQALPAEFFPARAIYEPRAWFSSALALVLTGSMFIINSNTDIIMLGILADMESAGIYKVATRGAELVAFVLVVTNTPLAPIISKLYAAKEFTRLQKGITKSTRAAFALSILIAVPLILASVWFMALFGDEFVAGATALQILCVGQLFNVLAGSVGFILIMTGHEHKAAMSIFVAAILNIILNAILIPLWGIEGAATATALSTITWNTLMIYFVVDTLHLNPTVLVWNIKHH
jgi:O-antigen/teichoic acid export membrane protein